MNSLLSSIRRAGQTAKSAALVACGMAALSRAQFSGQGVVLVFHGVCSDRGPVGVSDTSLHLKVSVFRALCRHLAVYYHVMPLREMVAILRAGDELPDRAVALSFDDGYASNYDLAFPILNELRLPATVFLATGFLDGTAPLWFQQVDLALAATGTKGGAELEETLNQLKQWPDDAMRREVAQMAAHSGHASVPDCARPLSWDQVREMQRSGIIDFGGHTHTHPILTRCSLEKQRWEIETCRDRIREEVGFAPKIFAYPNGGPEDWTEETQKLAREAGFEAALTMISGRIKPGVDLMTLPRYGTPGSLWEIEATVSGAFEMARKWRGGMGR
ncbi:Polysaccharide deacetylase [Prosthecobacter debontii]|uniref:Polysaccharide deacetylase n=1 Tax=Prosthecobacter debontii TaxID=48467 RepID=A0A1T4YUK8_9BACT|nr:polysaccharide deacetylase family protein [Prosthecobacter debontii]SKB05430.1 Polysaccharide deacetylase [Prosthecobacter debontii]